MIVDRFERLSLYVDLVPSIARLEELVYSYAPQMDGFDVNATLCTLFIPQGCRARVATGWREAAASRDVTGAVEIGEGDFALFIPGERYIVKCDGRCRKYTLE